MVALLPLSGTEISFLGVLAHGLMKLAREMRVDLTRGYLFRPTTPDLGIKDAPSTSSVAESRYL